MLQPQLYGMLFPLKTILLKIYKIFSNVMYPTMRFMIWRKMNLEHVNTVAIYHHLIIQDISTVKYH